jgi:hypothetical protein
MIEEINSSRYSPNLDNGVLAAYLYILPTYSPQKFDEAVLFHVNDVVVTPSEEPDTHPNQ